MVIIKKMKKIAVIGGGGFGQEVFCIWRDILESQDINYEFVGFYDDNLDVEANVYGKVVGTIDDLNQIDFDLEVAIAIGNPKYLDLISKKLINPNLSFPNVIHPTVSFLDKTTTALGQGNIFSIHSIVSCNVTIGDFNVFNTRATLGHDDVIGNYNVFSPNAQISGTVTIGNSNFFGFNCGVIQGKKIGERNMIGAGAVLLRSIKDDGTYIGVPAKKMSLT